MAKYVTNYKREGGKTFRDDARPAQTESRDGATTAEGQPPLEPAVPKTGTKEK